MPKVAMKRAISKKQAGLCAITEALLPTDPSLMDTHRLTPKLEGGTYTDENTVVTLPPAHMAEHGILRERTTSLDEIKSVFDDRVQTMKLQLKINNQLLAYQRRTDHIHPETVEFLESQLALIREQRLDQIDKKLAKLVKAYPDPLAQAALKVKGLGPVTVAALLTYVDLTKAETPSALWQYVGLDRPSHERYQPNPEQQEKRKARGPEYYGSTDAVPTGWGGNKTLRTVLWNTANVMMKLGEGGYRLVYDRTKARLSVSEKVVKTRNTKGQLVECAWKDTKPSHRHGAALRAVMKHLLADYWLVGRTLAGLRTTPLYVEAQLGHTDIISPRERGWEF